MNNAVFGKTMENVRDRIEIKTAFGAKYLQKYVSKPNFYSSKVLVDDKMVLMKLNKKTVQWNKQIHAGLSILELSKFLNITCTTSIITRWNLKIMKILN